MRSLKQMDKKGQEEIVGFALILIIVSIILLVVLSVSLRNSDQEVIESYEAQSFVQSFLKYTSDCRGNFGYQSVQDLIFECHYGRKCSDERDVCVVLNFTLKEIIDESWNFGVNMPYKGYKLEIIVGESLLIDLSEGDVTRNSKGSFQEFSKGGELFNIYFTIYE